MARTITILHTRGCPNVTLARRRLEAALARIGGPAPEVTIEEVADLDAATQRNFTGSPTIFVDDIDPFATPGATPAYACRTYATATGVEGAPSVEQLIAILTDAQSD